MRQRGLTVITEILPGKTEALRKLLNEIGTNIDENGYIDFYSLSTVHFMRWVIVPAAIIGGEQVPAQLALSTNYDGKLLPHLEELVEKAEKGIRHIYAHCKGFPGAGDHGEWVQYLHRNQVKNAAFYVGTLGRTVKQIQQENALRSKIENHLQTTNPEQDWQGEDPVTVRKRIMRTMSGPAETAWFEQTYRAPLIQRWGAAMLGLRVLLVLGVLIAGLILLGKVSAPFVPLGIVGGFLLLAIAWFVALRAKERKDTANFKPSTKSPDWIRELSEREDYRVQNQLTHLVNIKPGRTRRIALKLFLGVINLLARYVYNKGNLGGIPSIHFARWAIIDGGKRLIFFSNFDGSWESYLGEFIDRASIGLTGVWSNTEDFPPTKNLVLEGARHSTEFKAWARAKQIETQVWYSAYKTLSVNNINNNTGIRQGMIGDYSRDVTAAWLQRL